VTELQLIPLIHKVYIKIIDIRRPSQLQLNFLAEVHKIIINKTYIKLLNYNYYYLVKVIKLS
jgi:hypothetical protein